MLENFSAIVLAAGLSERMGSHKALLPYDGHRCFVQKITSDFYRIGCQRVVLVANGQVVEAIYQRKIDLGGVGIVLNVNPDLGRFYSLFLGLNALEPHQHVFVTNVDNPLVPDTVLLTLVSNAGRAHYIYPVYQGKGGHPILLSPEIAAEIRKEQNFTHNIKEYLGRFPKIGVDVVDESILVNINSLSDYEGLIRRKG